MASFCSSCGLPLAENVVFCSHCGARSATSAPQSYQPSPAPQPQPQTPDPQPSQQSSTKPAASGGSCLKILAVVVVCVLVMGAVAAGTVMYFAYRVKTAVVETAKNYGVPLPTTSAPSTFSSRRAGPKDPCSYLSKDEVRNLVGEPIDRMQVQDNACLYMGPPGLAEKLSKERASEVMKRAQRPGGVGTGDATDAVDQLVNGLAGAAGQGVAGGETPMLMLMVAVDDGKAQMTALIASRAIFGGIGKAAGGGMGFGADIQGLGDRAVRVPKLGLNVLKGESLIRIIAGPIPDANRRMVDIARAVLPKL